MRIDHYRKASELLHDIGVAKMVLGALKGDASFANDNIAAVKELSILVAQEVKNTPFLHDRIQIMILELRKAVEADKKALEKTFDDL